jgi:predicted PurR-regulated permease PerM
VDQAPRNRNTTTAPATVFVGNTAADRAAPPPDPVAIPAPASVRAWPPRRVLGLSFTAGVGLVLAWFALRAIGSVAGELTLIALALIVALGLDPIVGWLERRGLRRGLGVAVVSIATLLVLGALFAVVVPPIVAQTRQLVRSLPGLVQQLRNPHTFVGRLDSRFHVLQHLQGQLSQGSGLPVGGVLNIGLAVIGGVAAAVTFLVLTVYFLANLPAIRDVVYRMFPASRRTRVRDIGDDIGRRVGGYVLGQLLCAAVAGLGTFVFLVIVHVPYAAALGMLVAVLALIPVVGSTLGGILVTLVALSVSVGVAIASAVFYTLYRLFEDNLLVPRIMNRTVEVPPVLTIVSLLIGGALLGIVGAFLAIPVAAAIRVVVTRVVWPRLDSA